MGFTIITVDRNTRNRLASLVPNDSTFDEIIQKLLKNGGAKL